MLVHNVYFTISNPTPEREEALVAACRRYLKVHPGVVFFAAGTLEPELARPVNDRDFHVGLHVVFADRQAHDDYQVSDAHQRFISENKSSWAKVRVFDSIASE